MKKYFILAAMILASLHFQPGHLKAQPIGSANMKKGTVSGHDENTGNEQDPLFRPLINTSAFQSQLSKGGSSKHLSELENGLQIVKDIINKMITREYSFSLLHQHKYMVNDCLGLKVSAGEFSVRFAMPVIEISETGKIKIKLEVNRINLTALKVRMRPRSPDFSDPNPCHFSGKFEIGGEVTDLVLRAEINPLAQALTGPNPGYCFLAFSDEPIIKWSIGGINLKPLQNNLDGIGKDMIEEALNNRMSQLFYTIFIDISREIMPKYFAGCEKAYAANKEIIAALPSAATNEPTENTGTPNEALKWTITPVPTMKGVLGRLNTKFPADVDWSIDFKNAADNKFITNRSSYSRHAPQHDVKPGNYNFVLNSIAVENVPIEKGKETRLKAGVLHIVSEGVWEILSESKEKFHTSGNKPKKMALPVGNYQLKLGGQFFPMTIKDGETVEM